MFRCSHTIIRERINNALPDDVLNFKIVFKTIPLCISW